MGHPDIFQAVEGTPGKSYPLYREAIQIYNSSGTKYSGKGWIFHQGLPDKMVVSVT